MNNEVIVKPETFDIATLSTEGVTGFESVSPEDLPVPYLKLLQSGAPQVKMGPEHVEGATEGQFFNTVTKQLYGYSVRVIPCAFKKRVVEWQEVPGQKAKIVGMHEDLTIIQKAQKIANKQVLPNGNTVALTAYHYVLVLNEDGSFSPAVMALKSTQLKISRQWWGLMQAQRIRSAQGMVQAPTFAFSYLAKSTVNSNAENSWVGWSFSDPKILTSGTLFKAAEKFCVEINREKARVDAVDTEEDSF